MPFVWKCGKCGSVIYESMEIKTTDEIIAKFDGRCPKCGKRLDRVPKDVKISPAKEKKLLSLRIEKKPCAIRYCERTCWSFDESGKGFCSGYLKRPLKRFPKNDVILGCWFIDEDIRHLFMTPREALQVASYLAESFVAWRKTMPEKE